MSFGWEAIASFLKLFIYLAAPVLDVACGTLAGHVGSLLWHMDSLAVGLGLHSEQVQ